MTTPASSDTATVAADGLPEVTVLLDGKSATITMQAGDTILETARRAGLAPPFSCEAGNCGTCMAKLTEGTATMRVNDALDDDEVDEGAPGERARLNPVIAATEEVALRQALGRDFLAREPAPGMMQVWSVGARTAVASGS